MNFSGMCIGGPLAGQLAQAPVGGFDVALMPDAPLIVQDHMNIDSRIERMSYIYAEIPTIDGAVGFFILADVPLKDAVALMANGYRGLTVGNTALGDNLALSMAALIMAAGGEIRVPRDMINDGLKGMSIHKHDDPSDGGAVVYTVKPTEPGKVS